MSSRVQCPHHPSALLIEDCHAGDMICPECGLVVGDRVIDVGSEWRTFSNEKGGEDRSRVGGSENPLLSGGNLSTMIGPATGAASYDSSGNLTYQSRGNNMSSSDRTLMNAFRTISSMCDRINLPRVILDRANELFKVIHDGHKLRGRSSEAIAAASLYISCRQEGVPRTFKEIVAVSAVSKKDISRCFKMILLHHRPNVDMITTDDFMNRFCGNLNLPRSVQQAALHIAKMAVDLDAVPGRSPISVAAAAIYMASQGSTEKRNQKEIGEVSGVAESTIKQTYKLMLPRAVELIPPSFKMSIPIEKLPSS